MRRWNGWGDESIVYPLPPGAPALLEEWVGMAKPTRDVDMDAVVSRVGPTRLPDHPLVDSDPAGRLLHARGQSLPDWVALRTGQVGPAPDGVAHPENNEQVRLLLDYAKGVGAILIPYGGGTSVVGHINPLPGSPPVLTVDMRRLNRLQEFRPESRLATFGAGVKGPELEAQLRAHDSTLGHYPQSFEYSTLGGWVATRSTGQQSLGYGRVESFFAGGQLETPMGTMALPPDAPASAAGPDLRELVLGSEGRLGVLTEVTVRTRPLPEAEDFVGVFFPDFDSGREAVRKMAQAGLPLSMLRLSTARETETMLALAGHERLIRSMETMLALRRIREEKALLIVGATGAKRIVKAARKEAMDIAGQHGGISLGRAFGKQWQKGRFRTPYLRNSLWELGYAVDTLETATSWECVPEMVGAIEVALHGAMAEQDEKVHVFTHLSHVYPSGSSVYATFIFRLAPDPDETLQRWRTLKDRASQAVIAAKGTISHQHGVGIDHAPYLAAEKGPLGMGTIQTLCRHLDPDNMMNPGKLIADAGGRNESAQ